MGKADPIELDRIVGLGHSLNPVASGLTNWDFAYPTEMFISGIECDPENREAARDAAIAEMKKFQTGGVTEDELAKVKRQALSSQFSTLTTQPLLLRTKQVDHPPHNAFKEADLNAAANVRAGNGSFSTVSSIFSASRGSFQLNTLAE